MAPKRTSNQRASRRWKASAAVEAVLGRRIALCPLYILTPVGGQVTEAVDPQLCERALT